MCCPIRIPNAVLAAPLLAAITAPKWPQKQILVFLKLAINTPISAVTLNPESEADGVNCGTSLPVSTVAMEILPKRHPTRPICLEHCGTAVLRMCYRWAGYKFMVKWEVHEQILQKYVKKINPKCYITFWVLYRCSSNPLCVKLMSPVTAVACHCR
jgi:hypothetical protein